MYCIMYIVQADKHTSSAHPISGGWEGGGISLHGFWSDYTQELTITFNYFWLDFMIQKENSTIA